MHPPTYLFIVQGESFNGIPESKAHHQDLVADRESPDPVGCLGSPRFAKLQVSYDVCPEMMYFVVAFVRKSSREKCNKLNLKVINDSHIQFPVGRFFIFSRNSTAG